MRMKMIATLAFVVTLLAVTAHAQTVVTNPTNTTATASVDHNATNPLDGTPILSKYIVRVFQSANDQQVKAYDLGKPTPDAANQLKYLFVPGDFPTNVKLYLTWEAVGPTGLTGVSAKSAPFGWKAPQTPAAPAGIPGVQ